MKKFLCVALVSALLMSFSANAAELSFVNEEGIAGVSEPYYSYRGITELGNFGESAIANKYGDLVMDFSPSQKRVAPNGLIAILGENNKIGFADQKGNMVTEFVYDSFIDVHEKTGNTTVGYLSNMHLKGDGSSDLIPVSKDGKFGYINSYGTEVIPFIYEYAYGFYGGIAMICADGILSDYGTYTEGKYGYIKEDGTEILPADSYWIGQRFDPSLGYAEASNGSNHRVLIDKNGTVKECDENGFASIDAPYIVVNPSYGVYGVYDRLGNVVIPLTQSEPIKVKGNRFVVANTLRNENNEIIYSAPENASLFSEFGKDDVILVSYAPEGTFGERKYGCIDYEGNVIFEPEYDSVSQIGDGIIKLKKDGEYIISSLGGRVIYKSGLNPCIAYDGFLTMYDDASDTAYFALNPLKRPAIYLDEVKVNFTDAYPYFEGDRTMIPLRSVFEDAGAIVNWDADTGLISVTKDEITVSMKIGEKAITINDKTYESDRAPVAIENRTYVPLRVFSEGIGMDVVWDADNNRVYLNQ